MRRVKDALVRLYHGETRWDFVGRKAWWFALSSAVILAGVASLFVQGLQFSIEFVGGTGWELPADHVSVAQAHQVLDRLGLSEATVQILGTGRNAKLEVQARITTQGKETVQEFEGKVASALARLAHVNPKEVSVTEVGPSWGSVVTHKAIEALVIFLVAVALYVILFFEWRMAVAALVAVAHDILVTVGVYSLSGFQVTPDTVVAFLTILGYSLYDTMVIFHRIRDNMATMGKTGRYTVAEVVNASVNQVLARSLNTTLVAVFPIVSILVIGANLLGATTLQFFGLALCIGLLTGAYSSVFIASPLYAILKRTHPRFRAIEQSLARTKDLTKEAESGTEDQERELASVGARVISATDGANAPAQDGRLAPGVTRRRQRSRNRKKRANRSRKP